MPSCAVGGIRRFLMWSLIPATALVAWRGTAANDAGKAGDVKPVRSGRTPWTTSRVVGSPDPPTPFKVVRAFPNLKFDHPLLIARVPGGNRFIVGEQAGILYSFDGDRPDARAERFLDLPREIKTVPLLGGAKQVGALYGLASPPDFERNRQCFICYTLRESDPNQMNLP